MDSPKEGFMIIKIIDAKIKARVRQNRFMPRVNQPGWLGANGKANSVSTSADGIAGFTGESLI
jgi:hypothetical protein